MIYSIAACDDDFGIGKNGNIPWHNKYDFAYFKEQTLNSVIVMGANTWDSLPGKLPNRKTVVLSSRFFKGPDLILNLKSPKDCVDIIKTHYPNLDIWICGGPSIYKFFNNEIEQFHLTKIGGNFECDTFLDKTIFDSMTLQKTTILPSTNGVEIWMK